MDDARTALDAQELLGEAGRLRAIARRVVGDGHLAEDLVQDTWVAALESNSTRERDSDGWRAWIGAVTRNLSLRRLRRESHRPDVERAAARPESLGGVEDLAERMELQRRLTDAILELEEPYRSALVLRFLEGATPGEIARKQGITNANARRRVSRALGMLRERLGVEGRHGWAGCFGLFEWLRGFGDWGPLETPMALGQVGATGKLGLMGGTLMGAKAWVGVTAAVASVAVVYSLMDSEPLPERDAPLEVSVAELESLPPLDSSQIAQPIALTPPTVVDSVRSEVAGDLASAASTALLAGLVTDLAGRPLEGVQVVRCEADAIPDAILDDGEEPASTTNGSGKFQIERSGEKESVAFLLSGFVTEVREIPETGSLDVTLLASPRYSGHVRGQRGGLVAPPGKVRVMVVPAGMDEPVNFDAEIGADGRYRFDDLPVGTLVSVWARAKGFEGIEKERNDPLIAETEKTLDLELPKGLTVVGVVLDENTRAPIPFAQVWSEGFDYDEDSYEPTAVADDLGRFRIEGIERDENTYHDHVYHTVRLTASAPTHVASPLKAYMLQPDEEGVCELELRLASRSCSLHAVLYHPGGERVAQGFLVWGVDAENNFTLQSSNRRGEIDFEGLPAGKFGMVAYKTDRKEGEVHESLVFETVLEPESHDRLELELGSDASTVIEGRATNSRGEGVAGAEIIARYDLRFGGLAISLDSEPQLTDENGYYRFEGMRAGHQRIDAPGCALPDDIKFELAWGEKRRGIDFILGDCMTISGNVVLGDQEHEDLHLEVRHSKTGERLAKARMEADGSFAVEEVLAGDHDLVLMRDKTELDRARVNANDPTGILLHLH